MRLFIAIDFPKQTKKEIKSSIHFLTLQFPQISWIRIDNLHLTLKFLGNVEVNKLSKIKEGLESSLKEIKSFELNFNTLGFFPREQLVVWLGLKESSELLFLVNQIEQEMQKLGWKKEKRSYSPHVTLGRGKRLTKDVREKIKRAILSLPQITISPFWVSKVILMQSKLTPFGSIYSPIKNFALS